MPAAPNLKLIKAVQAGDCDRVQSALAARADVHVNNDQILGWAAADGHVAIIRVLLAAGAADRCGTGNAISLATRYGHAEAVRLLLTVGTPEPSRQFNWLVIAAENGHADVVRIFPAAGVDVHGDHEAALSLAAYRHHDEVVRILLAAGSDPVEAWNHAKRATKNAMMASLDARGSAMTAAQRKRLSAQSAGFMHLRSAARSARQQRALQR